MPVIKAALQSLKALLHKDSAIDWIVGTLDNLILVGVLLEAKNKGLIPRVKPTVDALMMQARFRISSLLYAEILRLAGEDDRY